MIRRTAFTLIELLVVIAIIAILAAILFPVFAQAKAAAKKSVSLSNTKQTATAFAMYQADSDDMFPSAHPIMDNGLIMGSFNAPVEYFNGLVPANSTVWNLAPLELVRASAAMWVNSTQPYIKSVDLLDTPVSVPFSDPFYQGMTSRPLSSLPRTHMTMNGLLHCYSGTAVTMPSSVPLIYYGNGKESYNGRAYTSPYMRCRAMTAPIAPCLFNPGGLPQGGQSFSSRADTYEFTYNGANDTTWTHGNGFVTAYTDTSAKFVQTPQQGTNTGSRTHPGYTYGTAGWDGTPTGGGSLIAPARCRSTGSTVGYMSWFRPDKTDNYVLGSHTMAVPCNQ